MEPHLKKGIIFGILGTILIGLQPIIANSRPSILDSHIFAAVTCLVEAALFLPIMFLELIRSNRNGLEGKDFKQRVTQTLSNWKKNVWLLIFIGLIFGLNQLLFFVGYGLAGSINGALTQKTTVFFSLLFGFLILKEKISKIQVIFSIVLFIGLIIAITEGTFFILFTIEFTVIIGVLVLLFITCLWMLGHTLTKPIFNRKEATPTQMVFVRNILSGIILIGTYFLYNPFTKFSLFLDPINLFYFIAMGVVYGTGLFCWYKTLSYLDVSKATIMVSPTPIVTAIFATILLGEVFTLFHLLGTALVIVSIIMIMREKKEK